MVQHCKDYKQVKHIIYGSPSTTSVGVQPVMYIHLVDKDMSTLKVGTIQDHTNSNNAMTIDSSGRVTEPNPCFANE